MPRKPFDFMIVSLNRTYDTTRLKEGDVCVATPYNWYGNTNGWDKDHPEASMLEAKEKEEYAKYQGRMYDPRTYWGQERGYVLHSKDNSFSCIVGWSNNHWEVLNIDGEDQTVDSFPVKSLEVIEKYLNN